LLADSTTNPHAPRIEIVATSTDVVARLSGRIDMDFAPVLREQILALLQDRKSQRVSIELSAITHIDSAGIATLIEALKVARGNGTVLQLQGLHGRLLRLLEVTGLLPLFNVHDSTMDQARQEAI
jgi:anti-sigma B factor antagonist